MAPEAPRAEGHALTLRAPAKLNWGLEVLTQRADGHHDIDTVYVATSLADEVTVTVREAEPPPTVAGAWTVEPGVPGASAGPMGGDDLALLAADAYLRASLRPARIHLHVHKRIPVAAGLGGGSSDAGAVLRALARLLPADVDLRALAATLGADVAFFARGHPAARGRGRGDRLTPLELPERPLVLARPDVPVRAAEAYGARQGVGSDLAPEALQRALAEGADPAWRNGLQAGVVARYPVVGEVLDALREAGLTAPLMSGSGATCFALAEDADAAATAASELRRAHPGWWTAAVRAPAPPGD